MPLKQTLRDLANEARRTVDEVDVEELREMLAGSEAARPIVIDVREPDERARGHIPGDVHIPRGVLERDIEKKAFGGVVSDERLDGPVICYCGGGSRSLLAAEALKRLGFSNALSLEGGFGAWGESGAEVAVDR